jgi:cytoskeletal protein CcmA (bactofilin family)
MFQKPSPKIALEHEEEPQEMPIQQEQHHDHDDVETVVGPSVNVEGDFASEGNIVVQGTVSGSVNTSKLLTVEQGAKIFANVHSGNAMVSGSIKGNIKIDDRLDLSSSAQIGGDITCKVLSVEAGALIHGKVVMKGVEIINPKSEKKIGLGRSKAKKE